MTTSFTRLALAAVAIALVAGACTGGDDTTAAPPAPDTVPAVAPDFTANLDWLSAPSAVTLEQLEGKIVIPYFWTSSCVTCWNVIADLQRLGAEFPNEVVLVGIHSGKYDAESETELVGETLTRLGVDHAVVNDPDFQMWRDWGATAWPTSFLVDPRGTIVDVHTGDGVFEQFRSQVANIADDFAGRGELVTATALFLNEPGPLPRTILAYPEAVVADVASDRLFVADTEHHRVVVADRTGNVTAVIGTGEAGRADGPNETATFNRPRGMALSADGLSLFIADTGNHLIRTVDLKAGETSTLAGTGSKAQPPYEAGALLETPLSYPWDVVLEDGRLLVTMRGANQVWSLDPAGDRLEPVAGSGRQGNDGDGLDLAEPAGLAADGAGGVFVADSASSTVRRIGPGEDVERLAGAAEGLFDFGDRDGPGEDARFQHPVGIAATDTDVWVADTFNHRIRRIDRATGEVSTLAGAGPGWRDGPDALFSRPSGLSVADGKLYVADAANHSIRVVDLATAETETLILKGIELLIPEGADEEFFGVELTLDPATVAPGAGRIVLEVGLPDGYKINPFAPSRFEWASTGGVAALDPAANQSVVEPQFPLEVSATFAEGVGSVVADLWIVYCEAETESICLFDRAHIEVPIEVGPSGRADLTIPYEIVVPNVG